MSELADFSTAEEVAAYLRLEHKSTITTLARNGKIGFTKIGRTTVFPREAVIEFAKQNTVPAKPNQWGLSDSTLHTIQAGRPAKKRAS